MEDNGDRIQTKPSADASVVRTPCTEFVVEAGIIQTRLPNSFFAAIRYPDYEF